MISEVNRLNTKPNQTCTQSHNHTLTQIMVCSVSLTPASLSLHISADDKTQHISYNLATVQKSSRFLSITLNVLVSVAPSSVGVFFYFAAASKQHSLLQQTTIVPKLNQNCLQFFFSFIHSSCAFRSVCLAKLTSMARFQIPWHFFWFEEFWPFLKYTQWTL